MKVWTRVFLILSVMLDAILPRRARDMRTSARTPEDIPLNPTVHELLGTRMTTLMDYRDPAVQDLIRSLKYDRSAHAAHLAAALLADYLHEELVGEKQFSTRPVLIVPVPLHASRARERGFNQIELVLEALPQEFKKLYAPHVLVRIRETVPQTRLSRSERLGNVAGAFRLGEGARVKKCRIFLIDDVTTTGATLVNAAHPLRRGGAEVSLVALARA